MTHEGLWRRLEMANLLWTIITILFVLWLAGLILHFGGAFIHLAIVVAVVLVIVNLLTGRSATSV